LFEALNLSVSRLIRTRYGTLAMPSVMKRGDTLELEAPEVAAVMDAVHFDKFDEIIVSGEGRSPLQSRLDAAVTCECARSASDRFPVRCGMTCSSKVTVMNLHDSVASD